MGGYCQSRTPGIQLFGSSVYNDWQSSERVRSQWSNMQIQRSQVDGRGKVNIKTRA